MCLIVFSWQVIANHPLIAVANRDEYYSRASAPAQWWQDQPQVFAPRDLQLGGTWIGVTKLAQGGHRFAALTNVRDHSSVKPEAPSRGFLVADYLSGTKSGKNYIAELRERADQFNGFNLLVGELSAERQELRWFSNRHTDDPRNGELLAPGIYGLANAALDAPWHKVSKTKAELASLLAQCAPQEAYFEMLSNPLPAPDCRLPDTGVALAVEKMLSAVCIESEFFGTRSSTVLTMNANFEMNYAERVVR